MSMTTELVKKLRRYAKAYTESPLGREVDGTKELLRKAADTIEELSLKLHNSQMERSSWYYNGGWIPCDERMPEEHDSMFAKFKGTKEWDIGMFEKISDDVNVTVEYKNGERKVKTLHTCDGRWVENSLLKFKVIAWQPLPPKYEPK